MADRLQKTIDVQPSVASVGNPAQADNTIAQSITNLSNIASDAIITNRKAGLEDEIRDLGDEVFAVREGRELEETSDRFKLLQKAKDQGKLTDTFVNIQTEKILKQTISKNPRFAPELRQEAARILGFDPTGSEVQALFGKSGRSSGSRPQSQFDKMQDLADNFAAVLGKDPQDVLGTMVKSQFLKDQVGVQESLNKIGQSNANGIFNAHLDTVESSLSDVVGNLQLQISQGGIVNPEVMKASVSQAKQASWAEFRSSLGRADLSTSPADLQTFRAQFEETWANVDEMVDSGTMEQIVTRQSGTLDKLASIQGFNVFGQVAVVNQAMGQEGVKFYLNHATKFQDPNQLKLLEKFIPAIGQITNKNSEVAREWSNSFNKVMGMRPTGADPSPGKRTPMDDAVSQVLIRDGVETEMRDRVLKGIEAEGKTFKSFGFYGQPGVRGLATDNEVQYIKDRWAIESDPLVARIATSLNTNKNWSIAVEDGEIIPKFDITKIGEGGGFLSANTSQPAGLSDDLKRLNSQNKLLQNGWSGDVGENSFGFLERTLNKITTLQAGPGGSNDTSGELQEAIDAVKESPTPANIDTLRALDPELVAEAERRALQLGGTPNGE